MGTNNDRNKSDHKKTTIQLQEKQRRKNRRLMELKENDNDDGKGLESMIMSTAENMEMGRSEKENEAKVEEEPNEQHSTKKVRINGKEQAEDTNNDKLDIQTKFIKYERSDDETP